MTHKLERSLAARTATITLAVLLAGRGVAWACPVCFGASDSPMAQGMNAGIFVLLGVTATMLAAIAVVGWRVAARVRRHASLDEPATARGKA